MIIDLQRFIATERPYWEELEEQLDRLEASPETRIDLETARRLHYLYERASADLQKLATFAAEPALHGYLESLVARAYGEIHESRGSTRLRAGRWLVRTLPRTFRRHAAAFVVSLGLTLVGAAIGGGTFALLGQDAKEAVIPPQFSHLLQTPAEQRRTAEAGRGDGSAGGQSEFAGFLFANNMQVSINALALGFTAGIGTAILLFYNGVLLGLTTVDFVQAGESEYLLGWLLPHGSVEIPAILIAGQCGFIIAHALIGWGDRRLMRQRFRAVSGDLLTLIGGIAVLLIWAAIVEAFFSQYHETSDGGGWFSYELKIAFGLVQLLGVIAFLLFAGIGPDPEGES